jgi:GH24 family phage-related lysozyme (muramidase)
MNTLNDYIKAWETFSELPYYATKDEQERGILTIGYGFTYPKDKCPPRFTEGEASTKVQNIISTNQVFANTLKITEYEKNALIALGYNIGFNAFPVLIEMIKKEEYKQALNQFYNAIYQSHVPLEGLIYRRACDANIFKTGVYERRQYITAKEKDIFLKMNANNPLAIDMINNEVRVK